MGKKVKFKSFDKLRKSEIGIGYKVFDPNWKCRDYQYEVGKEYIHEEKIELCESGFHFCPSLVDCFNYYEWDQSNKVAIIHYELSKTLIEEGSDKYVTSHIKIEKEINWDDVIKLCNLGIFNTGYRNSGDRNSGSWNSGDRNSGNRNSGNRNSGNSNSGDWNSGDRNSGDSNSGSWNSGSWNSGSRNSGDSNSGSWNSGDNNSGSWNSGSRNSGILNSDEASLRIFNKESGVYLRDIRNTSWYYLLSNFSILNLIFHSEMSTEEKEKYPYAEVTGGYLKVLEYKEAWKIWWKKLSSKDKEVIKTIPNFNKDIFKEITGISIRK